MPEDGAAREVRELLPLPEQPKRPERPERPEDSGEILRRNLRELIRLLGIEVPPKSETPGWRHIARNAIRKAFTSRSAGLSEDFFEPLISAAVCEPDPSHNRWFVEPAINAFGRRRVQAALLTYLQTGTDRERAGSVRAWYWTGYPLRQQHLRVGTSVAEMGFAADEARDVVTAWREASLREFVANEDLDVRCCILPGLPLKPESYPPELRALVDTAVAIARSHPDEYIRERVEVQVHH
ncbi:hypothetical protein Caci_2689 [Catenulispora acidiphila DSM 44928]|uniref:Uncharacterized protein n=1 Tax=Catenulispora acidiphila (strain DSM 44928 / JCM 14897 / NBRC 102108 / NRRL B-24433 / ID139908) TaxID=479433 RepID=C7PZE7_CATAD|nr:hypothetical protein [Catenulispora acidiphila]ACU71604.1 hypothetical protein Caci_2689 [Catenulispora acidiphila DSM 44928]